MVDISRCGRAGAVGERIVDGGGEVQAAVVEAACKTLVTQRLKVRGATWSRLGSRAILQLRAALQSDRFSDALDFHAVTRAIA